MIHGAFEFYTLRLTFRAIDSIHFPAGKSGNIVRGGFGAALKNVACASSCVSARTCESRDSCAYARIFEPVSEKTVSDLTPSDVPSRDRKEAVLIAAPSGLADPPRPFVFRAAHLDGATFAPGRQFHFDLHVFDVRDPAIPYYTAAFAQFGRQGIGPRRGRAELLTVPPPTPIRLSLEPESREVRRAIVQFKTPTELKAEGGIAPRPEFGILFARIRDRIGTLRGTYGTGPLDIDHRGMGERAARVRMSRCELRMVEAGRRSSRNGQTHSIGGFAGEAEYEGDLGEFLPYLRAAKWTGVGRQTVWGKGEIEVREAAE